MTAAPLLTGLAVLAAINLVAWIAFWWDKRAAVRGARRVPERTLLLLALIGGSPCALLARQSLRHKTRKEPFRTRLLLIVGLQVAVGAAGLAWRLGLRPL